MAYRQQSYSYSSRLVDPLALRPLIRILGEDARALKAKLVGVRNSAARGLKSCNTTLLQVEILTMSSVRGIVYMLKIVVILYNISYTQCT